MSTMLELGRHHVLAPESHVEWRMYDALRIVASYEYDLDPAGEARGYGEPISILPQVRIGRYRADFLVSMSFGEKQIQIVVECDGHDWHERTKIQASRDKRRDRTLQRKGYRVFRFTGSDIHRDVHGCAREVIAACFEWLSEQAAAAYEGDHGPH
jgi:very-short-patch-repair endonuclease